MSELRLRQDLFAQLLPALLIRAQALGFRMALGETFRPPETAALYAAQGRGAKNSLHCLKLAVDLFLFRRARDGRETYLTRTEEYAALGAYWKSLDPLCRWGGDFPRRKGVVPDGNHFSITYQDRA